MIKEDITKAIALTMVITSTMLFDSVGASAAWKKDNTGSRYVEGNSFFTGWKNIDNNWYYFDDKGYMKIDWTLIDGNWYYFYDNGQRATLQNINGYFVNSNGVYTNTITANEARQLILKEDGNYISKITNNSTRFSSDYREYSADNFQSGAYWNMPKESYYEFYVHVYGNNGEVYFDSCEYLVGKESKNVYIAPNQGGMSLYQIKDNKKVKTFKYTGEGGSYEWR